MNRIIIQHLEEDTDEKCLCGATASQVRIHVECSESGDEYVDGDEYIYCEACAKQADDIKPEDLI